MAVVINGTTGIDTIQDGTVSTAKIAADAVTTPKIAETVNLGRRNLIINGAMQVAQRGSTTGVSNASGYYACDRWHFAEGGFQTQAFTMSQSTDAPDGFGSSFKIDVTTAASPASDNYGILEQRIEGQNLQGLKKGTSDAKDLTVSFWVKSPKTGTHICGFFDLDNTRTISKPYTVSSANTWEYHTITFPGDTGGSGFDNDNARSLDLRFYLYLGSNYAASLQSDWGAYSASALGAGQVNIADSTDNNFYLTGVQLEMGDTATPFEYRSSHEELLICQKYFHIIEAGSGDRANVVNGSAFTGSSFYGIFNHPVEMRTSPSCSVDFSNNDIIVYGNDSANSAVSGDVVFERIERNALRFRVNNLSLTQGRSYWAELNNTANYKAIKFDAEL